MHKRTIDITNQKFGKLTVLSHIKNGYWKCLCECGNEKTIRSRSMRTGKTVSCGCWNLAKNLVPIVGKRFNGLLVIEELGSPEGKDKYKVRVRCDCGIEKVIFRSGLGLTKSCGCKRWEEFRKTRREKWKKYAGQAARKRVFDRYNRNAHTRGLVFGLNYDVFLDLITRPCAYCGNSLTTIEVNQHNNGDFSYTGIDRSDNTQGYTIENSVPCCFGCNQAKLKLSSGDFKNWIRQVYSHWAKHEST